MSFSAALPPNALKAFGHGLEALMKFGDDVNIEAKTEQLILWTINTTITGQAILRMSPALFEKYTIKRSTQSETTTASCKLLLKTLRKIIKSNQHRSSNVKQCELKLNGGPPTTSRSTGGLTGSGHRLYLKFVYENGISKTTSLWYTDVECNRPLFTKNLHHSFTIDPTLFYDYIAVMDNRIQGLSFIFSSTKVLIKTFWDSSIGGKNAGKPMQSQFKIPNHNFVSYNVNADVSLTVNLKEFKTAVSYGVETNSLLQACFEETGKPIILTVEQTGYVIADFVVMPYTGNEEIMQSSGLSMNDNSIATNDTGLSIPRPSPAYVPRNHHQPSSAESQYSPGPPPRPMANIIDSGSSLEMVPPSFEQQKKQRQNDSIGNNDDPLFPFGSPPVEKSHPIRSSHLRQASPPPAPALRQQKQQQQHTTNNNRVFADDDTTTDDEEMLFVAQHQPQAKKRFFDSSD